MVLEKIARFSFRRRWLMVITWIVALVGFNALSGTVGGEFSTDFSLPGADSQAALDLLSERFPQVAGDTADIVFEAEQGVDDPEVQETMAALFADLGEVDRVVAISSPYDEGGEQQISPDGTIAFATMRFEFVKDEAVPIEIGKEIQKIAGEVELDGLTVEPGGSVVIFSEFEEPGGAEGIGVLFAIIILLIAFGSVLAMGLPIGTALFGIGIGMAMIMLLANIVSVPEFTPQLASMIGIGVGIDYALFIVTRYRSHLHEGMEPEAATMLAILTSGKAVLFAGTVVVVSLLGILLMGFAFVEGLAIGGAATVAVTMLAAITLLPALLGFVGEKIDRWKIPGFHGTEAGEKRAAYRWSRFIQRRSWVAALVGLTILVVMSIPLFSLRLGFADASAGSPDRTSRRAYDLLSKGFGPGFNGPLLLATEIGSPDDLATLEELGSALSETEGVAAVSPPQPNEEGDAAVMTVFPTTSPQDVATNELVQRIREDVIPEVSPDHDVYVGGLTASVEDFATANSERLPVLISVVLLLSFLLLVVVFRSIVVPVKAVVMNLLSISAAYGAIVAVFQWGWLKEQIGIETSGPIEAWVPMMLFTILFGLSMDYEIFLLSRIREEYVRTGNNYEAVANGLAATARVITAAAAIMVTLFLVFMFAFDERAIKLFGMGLAVAIFVDATLVRMVLVPATMELLGEANWWLPKWLDRLLPKFKVEGDHSPPTAGPDGALPIPEEA